MHNRQVKKEMSVWKGQEVDEGVRVSALSEALLHTVPGAMAFRDGMPGIPEVKCG